MTASPTALTVASFGAWLIAQVERPGALGELARIATADDAFPIGGDFEAALGWAVESMLRDDLLEVTLPSAAAEFEREARR